MKNLGLTTVLASVLLMQACGSTPSSPSDATLPGIAVLNSSETGTDDARLEGVLQVEKGCVVLFRKDVGEAAMVMWPPGTKIEAADEGGWSISSPALEATSSEGDDVAVDGGERRGDDVPPGAIPTGCESNTFWVASPVDS